LDFPNNIVTAVSFLWTGFSTC